jgi:uncharacterized protein (DUF1800 family)
MSSPTNSDVGGLLRPPGQLDIRTALEPHAGVLGDRAAAHMLRRAAFGASPADVRRYASMQAGDAVESLIRFAPTNGLAAAPFLYDATADLAAIRGLTGDDFIAQKRVFVKKQTESMMALRLWWLNRMLLSPAPLQERMTLFFHGHFTSLSNAPVQGYAQNQLYRDYALGNLRELTRLVSKDASMLIYLSGNQNVAAHPNENYARELMELFTLGLGNYTENDVRESARAWTGWRALRYSETVRFNPRLHDNGTKTFLGQTGNFTGDDIVNIIFTQPACARFFAGKLLSLFVYDDPEPELVDAVAALIRKHDFELAPAVSTILRSEVFYSPRAYRALVKSPVDFVVGTYKLLGLPSFDLETMHLLPGMGQTLFVPPNVAGWPGGQNWLTSGTMIARQNFLLRSVTSQNLAQSSWLMSLPLQTRPAARALIETILQGDASADGFTQLEAFLDGAGSSALGALSAENAASRISGAADIAMAMPAYQLN